MEPNHWNYNLQYGHSTSGGLPATHTSLNRLDLTSGLGLTHSLQASHGSLSGRSMASVNYGLGVPVLETMSSINSGISSQQSHKGMSLGQGQLVFEPQLRVQAEQQSPTYRGYDSSKALRADSLARESAARNQLLEAAAAARMWGPSSSLYNQFGSILSEVSGPTVTTLSSPVSGTGSIISPKSNQIQMHDPPPAHSSNTRHIQRNLHSTELLYGRSTESLIPSGLTQISVYSSSGLSKQTLVNSQQQVLHRHASLHNQQSYASHNDIEDLSSNSQNQPYGSYANLSVNDSQDFSPTQLSGDINYEAVSPASSMNESSQANQEHSSFSIVQFPDLANLTSEHAHTLADKFQENDFRLKIDTRAQQQHEILSSHLGQRQDLSSALKIPKDMPNLQMLSMPGNQRGSQFQQLWMGNCMSMPQSQISISSPDSLIQVSQHNSLTTSSMQQPPAPIPIQALADSTTKPKRPRSRKKKEPNQPQSPGSEIKKSPVSMSHNILNLPPSSPHVSTLPMASHVSQTNQMQGYRNSNNNQFLSRDIQRAQTPSMPQNYSIQDHQSHGYPLEASPKLTVGQNQNLIRNQNEFILPNRLVSEKTSNSYKQAQRKSVDVSSKSNNLSNQVYRSNIPDNQQHLQTYASHTMMASSGQHRVSPMQDNRTGIGRMQGYSELSSQQKMASQMSPLEQLSPQSADSSGYSNKMNSSGHILTSGIISSQSIPMSHSPMDSRPVSVEPSAMHAYEQAHSAGLIDAQDSAQFQLDFSGQPFLEQLVSVHAPLTVHSGSYGQSAENGEVVFTTLVSPADSARLHQHHDSASNDGFRPTYHGEAVHEIRPIGSIGGHLGMEDVTFNAFFDNQRELDTDDTMSIHQGSHSTPESDKMSLTFVPRVVEDDELSHFTQPGLAQPVMVKKEIHEPKPQPKDSFQNSFLSYLQGHKQETLSSVSSSAVTKKPQLPKYIPEPRRPKPVQPPRESLNLSDAEDSTSKFKDSSMFSDNDSSHKSESDREGYSVQRTSELAVKITLPKNKKKNRFGPFAESSLLKDSMRKNKESASKRKRKKGKHRVGSEGEDLWPADGSDDDMPSRPEVVRESTPPPVRTSIGRKAKEKCIEKTTKHSKHSGSESSSDDDLLPFKGKKATKSDDSDKNYDSDKDPVWMPFDVDLKQGHEFDEKRKKAKRRVRTSSTRSNKSAHRVHHSSAPSHNSVAGTPTVVNPCKPQGESSLGNSEFKVGMFVIEKKDKLSFDSYPIWRIEPDRIRKFEYRSFGDTVQHVAVETYTTWMKSMESQFEPIKVHEVEGVKNSELLTVKVLDECRPKPQSDRRLETEYEDDPLIETFNVYLQVFLSQALEPNFLSVILNTQEKFYIDALNLIDDMIEAKCKEITRLAHWKLTFLECLHRCPLMKEIDRPNLKQPCQASENSSPPTIKSVILSGNPYDRFLLTEQPQHRSEAASEFMIGKVAAYYVRTYHSLYHFKYWLNQRCDAKVKTMKESNKLENISNEFILDKCLENSSWVLQSFDNLKNLLKYGGEAPR
ncbi:uncharacterized protein LOC131955442 [Physella acuta]|uniref:uncharacterized protein LOC131955442 n=1 Tax=Physella acuta TaxID=109671 RepID=UPI0027DBC52E|nr:uncharacterized protein LOC131955442 [Physella acuta]